MRQSWGEFLRGAGDCSHGVQVYGDVDELADSVAAFLSAGFERGQPAAIVATPEHLGLFALKLEQRGWPLDAAERDGLAVLADAQETLTALLGADGRMQDRFDEIVGGLLDSVRRDGAPVRAFGEMVDLLCRRGDVDGAAELERLWNDLATRQRFSLLCGYRLDVFDVAAQNGSLPHICREHSHVLPARNYPRFARAVDEALREVLGPSQAASVYVVVSRTAAYDQVPLAQSILMWISENMPAQSHRILDAARTRYA